MLALMNLYIQNRIEKYLILFERIHYLAQIDECFKDFNFKVQNNKSKIVFILVYSMKIKLAATTNRMMSEAVSAEALFGQG